jgi:hypothetical protein
MDDLFTLLSTDLLVRFDQQRINTLLDSRDSEWFEAEWLRCDKEVDQRAKSSPLLQEQVKQIDKLREEAYKAAYRSTGNPEIAACVSEDFALLASARIVGFTDSFLERLLGKYSAGHMPGGK